MEIKSKNLFVLVSPARSASTSLRITLDNHPKIAMHGELFGKNNVHGISKKTRIPGSSTKPGVYHRNIKIQNFCDIFFPDDKYQYGFNMLLEHWFIPDNFRFFDALTDTSPKLIILWRRDLLARLKSELLFKFDLGLISQKKLEILSSEEIEADCEKQILMIERINRELIQLPNIKHFTIYFEDLVSSNQNIIIPKLQKFIGVKSNKDIIISKLQKFIGVKSNKQNLSHDIYRNKAINREYVAKKIDNALKHYESSIYKDYRLDNI